MVCTVAAVVFLLALNSYCVVITNKYCEKNPCLQYHPPKLSGQRTWFQSSMTKYSHNMRLVNPPLCSETKILIDQPRQLWPTWPHDSEAVRLYTFLDQVHMVLVRLHDSQTSQPQDSCAPMNRFKAITPQAYWSRDIKNRWFNQFLFMIFSSICSIQGIH